MRYVKVVLVAMLSFFAGLGVILGGMYLFGAFDKDKVDPESIYFEKSVYNVDDDFAITIKSNTENVTVTDITLSLSDAIGEEKIGGVTYIANNSIIIPKYVKLNQPFEVELIRGSYQAEGLNNWILGGSSTITAKSDSLIADEKSVDINVDVPVYSLEVVTKTADNLQNIQTEFAMGDTFIAEAKFVPSISKFKYSTTETKSVYFEAVSTNNAIVENKGAVSQDMDQNTTTCFDALMQTNNAKVNAYVFTSSVLEDLYETQYSDDQEALVRELKNNPNSLQTQKTLTFSELVVNSFGLEDSLNTQKVLAFNHSTQIFANNINSNTSLGLTIKDSKGNKFQSQIKNIGLRAFVKKNNTLELATADDLIFLTTQTKTVGQNTYYLPTILTNNVENSYWQVVALNSEGTEFVFELTLFDGDQIVTLPNNASNPITTESQVWKNFGIDAENEPDLYWASTDDVNMTFIDSMFNPTPAVLDLSSLIRFSDTNTNQTNGTYRTVKYLAYSQTNEELSGVISGATKIETGNSKYSSLNITATLYELPDSNLTVFSNGEFNIVAVVLFSDYNGLPTDNVFKFVTDKETGTILQPLKIVVQKTVKLIDVTLNVNGEVLKNQTKNATELVTLDKLAFLQKSANSIENIFDIVFTVSAQDTTMLKQEVKLFVEAFTKGDIAVVQEGGDLLKIENPSFNVDYNTMTGTEWSYSIPVSAKSLNGQKDTIVKLKWTYKQTETSTLETYIAGGDSIVFSNLANHAYKTSDFVQIEIYDGLPDTVNFGDGDEYATGYVNSIETPIYKSLAIESQSEGTVNYATSLGSQYKTAFDGEDITEKLIDQNGQYILSFKDKYENVITSSDYKITPTTVQNVQKLVIDFNAGYYSSSLTTSPTDELYIFETEVGTVQEIQKNTAQIGYDDVWVSIKDSYLENTNTPVLIERYGQKDSIINLAGTSGLLKFEYLYQGVSYELCNIISCNLITELPDSLEYDKVAQTLTVKTYIGSNTKLTFVANTHAGYTLNIQLTILPNIDATFEIIKTTPAQNALGVNEVYSDINATVKITLTSKLGESFLLELTNLAGDKKYIFDDNALTKSIVLTAGGTQTVKATAVFGASELGENTLVAKTTDTNANAFAKQYTITVKPNLMLNGADANNVLKIEAQIGENPTQFLKSSHYKRIISVTNDANLANYVSVAIAETINGQQMVYSASDLDTPLAYTLFELTSNNSIKLASNQKMLESYVVKLNLLYNGEVVSGASIELTLNPNIAPNTANSLYSQYFKNYNGQLALVLKSSSQTQQLSQLRQLFKNIAEDGFMLSASGQNLPYTISGNNLLVTTTKFVAYYDKLSLKNAYTDIYYPIVFTPVDFDFVIYQTDGQNQTATQIQINQNANNDLGYANDAGYLIQNNVFDTYNSGEVSSIFRTNYTLTNNAGTFTVANHTPNPIYIVAYDTTNYYVKTLSAFGVNGNSYPSLTFALNDMSGFEIIDPSLTANISLTNNVGVYTSNTVFDNSTKLDAQRSYGLSQTVYELINANYSYNVRLYDDQTGYELTGYIFDKKSGFVQFNNSTTDCYALAKFTDGTGAEFLVYRIFIKANSQINIYYPYAEKYFDGEEESAEYVYASSTNRIIVDFNQKLAKKYPNSVASEDVYRVMLQNGTKEIGFTNSKDYTINYTINSVTQNGKNLSSTEILLAQITMIGGVLSLPNDFVGEIVVKANVTLNSNSQDMGYVLYKIVANDASLEDYVLRVGQDEYKTTKAEISYGNAFDFGNILLYKYITNSGSEGITNTPNGFLRYHYYSTEIDNLDQYFNFDLQNKTLSIKENLSIVNDVVTNFVFYTIYGAVHTVELTFKSTILNQFNASNNIITENNGIYEIYADMTFDFANVFNITDNGATIALGKEDFSYKIDGDYISGKDVCFTQDLVGQKTITVKVNLKDRVLGDKTYDDDYEFNFELNIKQSLKSNYPQNAPLAIGDSLHNEIIYSQNLVQFKNKLFAEDMTISQSVLFSSYATATQKIISQYQITYEIRENNTFVDNISINLNANSFSILFSGAPKASTSITIIFTLTKGDVVLKSYANFNLVPDINIAVNYPFADEANINYEAIYLNPAYIFANQWSGGYSSLSINGNNAYFNTDRITFKSAETNQTITASTIGDRLTLSVKSVGEYLKIRQGDKYNTDIQHVDFSSNLEFKWNSATEVAKNATESVVFSIFIDNIEVAVYEIKFFADMGQIFTLNINNLYDLDAEYETYYVENASSEAIFSNKTVLFSFQTRSDLRQTLTLEAFVDNEKVGEKTISGNLSYDWLLIGAQEINSQNLIFKIKGESTEYILASGSAYSEFFREDSVVFTYRVEISYMNLVDLDYADFKNDIVGTEGNMTVDNFAIYKANKQQIDVITQIPFKKNGLVIGNYQYTLKYDLKVAKNHTATEQPSTIKAGESSIGKNTSGLAEFGITRLDGTAFDQNYFANHNTTFSLETIMVTSMAFENNPTSDNVRYYYAGMADYCNQIITGGLKNVALGSNYYVTTNIKYIGDATTNPKYDFYIEGNGAENGGNIVYILFKYYPTGCDFFTYEILKVKIEAGVEYNFVNDEANPTTTINTANERLIIEYIDGTTMFDPITLATMGDSKVNIVSSTTSTNLAVTSNYSYEVVGDIKDYVKIEFTNNISVKLTNGTKQALYGNKKGYILITDAYGFEMKYYLEILASSDYALRLPDADLGEGDILVRPTSNDANLKNFDLYEGTELQVIDVTASAVELEEGQCAVSVVNLSKIVSELGFSYTVTYKISSLDFESALATNKCTLPILSTNKSVATTLDVIIDINKGNGEKEVVTLSFDVQIIKRYIVGAVEGASVRESVKFDVSNYIAVSDRANNELTLGDVEISNKTRTLVVSSSQQGMTATVTATPLPSGTPIYQTLVVGKDANGMTFGATNGYYYHKLQSYSAFNGLDLTKYSITVQGVIGYSVEDDIIVSLITSKVADNTEPVYVNVNNKTYKLAVPFYLNLNGKQTKSLREYITSAYSGTQQQNYLANIGDYTADAEVISSQDVRRIKNYTIFNDNLRLLVAENCKNVVFQVRVYTSASEYKVLPYVVSNNYAHYFNVSISEILDLEKPQVNVSYKVEVVYDYLIGDGAINEYDNLITFADYTANKIDSNYDNATKSCEYIHTLNSFEISEFTYDQNSRMFEDEITVLSSQQFVDNDRFTSIIKYYLVQYSNDNIVVKVPVSYSVTPKYYALNNYGQEHNMRNDIYMNQYEILTDGYKVDFDVWASKFTLLDKYSSALASLNTCKEDLVFDLTKEGSGSAVFNANYDLITTDGFNFDQFFVIAVKVKVNGNADQLVAIGNVHIQLSQSHLYVEATGKYTITITSPQGQGTTYTTNVTHVFNKNVESITDILTTSFADNYNKQNNTIKFYTSGDATIDYPVEDCTFAIVTVIDGVYSAVPNGEKLDIKIKINENQTAQNKNVTLCAVAVKIGDPAITYRSSNFNVTINYNGNYSVSYNSQTFTKSGNYYTVSIPFTDIFSTVFVNTDFNYTVNIVGVTESNLDIVYFNFSETDATLNQTLFFNLIATKNNVAKNQIIGYKFTENTLNNGGEFGYAIDISSLNLDMDSCTLTYISAFNLACQDNQEYNLLVKIKQTYSTEYCIANIKSYSSTDAFLVEDYAGHMTSLSLVGSSVEIFNDALISSANGTAYLPKYININPDAEMNKLYYYGTYVNAKNDMNLFGVVPSEDGKIMLDLSGYTAYKFVNVFDANTLVNGDVTSRKPADASTYTLQWKGSLNKITYHFVETIITYSPKSINGVLQTFYDFDTNPVLFNYSEITATLLSAESQNHLDLSAMVDVVQNDKTYNFSLTNSDNQVLYFATKGQNLSNVDVVAIAGANFANYCTITYEENIHNEVDGIGTVKYAVYNASGSLKGIKLVEYDKVVNDIYLITTQNPLEFKGSIYSTAKQVSGDSFSVSTISHKPYYVTLNQNGTTTLLAYYLTTNSIQIPTTSLVDTDDYVEVDISETSLAVSSSTPKTLTLYVDASDQDRVFIFTDGTTSSLVEILAGETSATVDLEDFTSSVIFTQYLE